MSLTLRLRPSLSLRALRFCLSFVSLSALHATPSLEIGTDPASSSAPLSLPADPNAQPPALAYLALRLAPDHPQERNLYAKKVTESGRVLLYYPAGPRSAIMGYRWQGGTLEPINRPAAEQSPYGSAQGFSWVWDMNDSGVVVGAYSHLRANDDYNGNRSGGIYNDSVYDLTACQWPAGQAEAQALPPPYPGLEGGYAAYHIADQGIIHGRMLERGDPLAHWWDDASVEYGLAWPSVSTPPSLNGSSWPPGDVATPQISRIVTYVSPQGLHTLGREYPRYFDAMGSPRNLAVRNPYLLDGLTLNDQPEPKSINDSGRWLARGSRSGQAFGFWSDNLVDFHPVDVGAIMAINNAHDILGSREIWKWESVPGPDGPVYRHNKYKISVALPAGWDYSGWDVHGIPIYFTTSRLFVGSVGRSLDAQGQPLPADQRQQGPALFVPVEMTWESLNANLVDENPNAGGGKRYFAGKLLPTETEPGNILAFRIKIPTQQGAQVKLRAFDVDDATPTSFDTAGVIDTNGDAGGDNQIDYLNTPKTGLFIQGSSLSDTVIVTLDENAEAVIQFKVGMQPGSNYRIVVALNNSLGNFDQLQTATTGALFVPSVGNQITGFTGLGALSPMLTVWRKLYIEQDSMAEVPTPRPYPDRAQLPSVLAWAVNNPVGKTTISEGSVHQVSESYYNDGFISNDVDGQKFTVEHYYAAPQLRIIGLPTAQQQNTTPWWIEDDDSLGLNGPILPRLNLINESVVAKFKPAFIVPVHVEPIGLNPPSDQTVNFDNNLTEADETYNTSTANSKENLRPYADDRAFWNQLLVAGYQGPENADGDPSAENPLEGINIDNIFAPPFAVAYLEGIRETQRLLFATGDPVKIKNANALIQEELDRVVAHEIAHSPQNNTGIDDHDEGALMDSEYVSPHFSPLSIARLRQTQSWR